MPSADPPLLERLAPAQAGQHRRRSTKTPGPPTRPRAASPWPTAPPKRRSPRWWAQLLTEGFLAAARGRRDLAGWLAGPRRLWSAEVNGLDLPWYAEIKREQGAFATFLGLGVRAADDERRGGWRAVAVGDSCLFHIRDGRLRPLLPADRRGGFGNRAALHRLARPPTPKPDLGTRQLAAGGPSVLMTDALAQWFLQPTRPAAIRGKPWRWCWRRRNHKRPSPTGSRSCASESNYATTM